MAGSFLRTGAAATLVVALAIFISPTEAFLPAADRSEHASSSRAAFLTSHQKTVSASSFIISRPFASSVMPSSSTSLSMAGGDGKKKRRRKRKAAPGKSQEAAPTAADDGELPGFDLGDDEQVEEFKTEASSTESSSTPSPSSPMASTSASVAVASEMSPESADMSDPKILDVMRGTQKASNMMESGTMDELLSNRELEKSLKFSDEEVKEDLPSLGQLAGGKSRGGGASSSSAESGRGSFVIEQKVGSKRARAEARRAAAQEAERLAEEEKGFLEKVPQFLDEKGEVSAIKILEASTWVGIGILVAWEAYINSPFFSRAAPMAPVVYELLF